MATPTIEARLADLETKVAHLLEKQMPEKPWWEQWFGAFKDNPDFDAAMQAGAAYRRAQPTAEDEYNV